MDHGPWYSSNPSIVFEVGRFLSNSCVQMQSLKCSLGRLEDCHLFSDPVLAVQIVNFRSGFKIAFVWLCGFSYQMIAGLIFLIVSFVTEKVKFVIYLITDFVIDHT